MTTQSRERWPRVRRTTDPQARRPLPGTIWAWEPRKPHAAELIQVVSCTWNGEEWHVQTCRPRDYAHLSHGCDSAVRCFWNELSRFWEASHAVARKAGPSSISTTRDGPPLPGELLAQKLEGGRLTILGYGRYGDDPQYVGCPRAKSDMTPCIARDGHLALAGEPFGGRRDCVGCYAKPAALLAELQTAGQAGDLHIVLAEESGRDLDDDDRCADYLTAVVREMTEHMAR